MDRMLTGGDSGEHVARELLLRSLPLGSNVSYTMDRDKGDELRVEFGHGAFVVRAPRLRLAWEPAEGAAEPAFVVGAYGGVHSWTREELRGWRRAWWKLTAPFRREG